MIAKFPEWSRFTTRHAAEYEKTISNFPPYGDLLLNGLLVWLDYFDNLEVSRLHQNVAIKFTEVFSHEDRQVVTLVGRNRIDDSFNELFAWQKEHDFERILRMVPGATIEALVHPKNFLITLDPDNSDYIISAERLACLEGSSMRKMRREVSIFQRAHEGKIALLELDLSRYENKRLIINSTHLWDHVFTSNDKAHDEGLAIDRSLQLAEVLNLRCLAIMVNGKLEGYSIFRNLAQRHWASFPHIKVSRDLRYTFSYLIHQTARLLNDENVKYINFEQDLGIPGLRQYKKQNLNPIGQLFKYTVKPATQD